MVLLHPASSPAGDADRGRPGILPAPPRRRPVEDPGSTPPELFAEYLRCYADPACRHAICEDYRAAAGIDLEHDAADAEARITAPLLALWGAKGVVGRTYDVLETWREKATDVSGRALDCGHTLQEERPDAVLSELAAFLR